MDEEINQESPIEQSTQNGTMGYMSTIKKTKPVFVVIDGNAIIHRAYHALPPMHTKEGVVVHAVYGFTSMMLRAIQDLKPDYLAVCFDVSGGTFRDDMYDAYKATRKEADQDLYSQIPLVREMVESFNIPVFSKKGFEADDVIGTLAQQIADKHSGVMTVVLTGDKDLLQLVKDDQTEVYLLKRGLSDVALYNEARVMDQFGFGPERVIDYKALCGDSSDNIPGVKGIGDKTAVQLIQKFDTLDDMFANAADPDWKEKFGLTPSVSKKLQEFKDDAHMSKSLATIKRDVPDISFELPDLAIGQVDWKMASDFLKTYEFFSLVKRLPIADDAKPRITTHVDLEVVTTTQTLGDVMKKMRLFPEVGLSLSVSGGLFAESLHGFGVFHKEHAYYIDISMLGDAGMAALVELVTGDQTIICYDSKTIRKVLHNKGLAITATVFDVMIASYILYSSTRSHNYEDILVRELDVQIKKPDVQDSLFGHNPKDACFGYEHLFALYTVFAERLEKEELRTLFDTIEMPLVPILANMELAGISIDEQYLQEMSKEVHKKLETLTKRAYELAGKEFNLASSSQLRDVLFDDLALPTADIKKGKTGLSTAASELEKLRGTHPIIELIEEYRELEKMRNTYIDVLPLLVNSKTGRIHSTFHQTVAATGRLSSSDPNVQNIPIRTELGRRIRHSIMAKDGCVLLSLDYSQFELRVLASLSKDEKLVEIFEKGEDVHTATAAIIHDIPISEVTKEIRRTAKEVNFGVLYGMGAFGLASRTGIGVAKAREFIEEYFEKFAGVKIYLDETIEEARRRGYVETLFQRRRYVPEVRSSNAQVRKAGERMAVNMPIQGTQADALKIAMIDVDRLLNEKGWQEDCKMLLQVHDELVFEVKESEVEHIAKEIQTTMQNAVDLGIPVVVEKKEGKHWDE